MINIISNYNHSVITKTNISSQKSATSISLFSCSWPEVCVLHLEIVSILCPPAVQHLGKYSSRIIIMHTSNTYFILLLLVGKYSSRVWYYRLQWPPKFEILRCCCSGTFLVYYFILLSAIMQPTLLLIYPFHVCLLQYTARFSADTVKNFLYTLNNGKIPKKRFNCK